MAEPTITDVLKAITALDTKFGAVDTRLGAVETKLGDVDTNVSTLHTKVDSVAAKVDALDKKLDALASDVAAHRAETKSGFAELDQELTAHTKLHNEIDRRLEKLEGPVKKPARSGSRAPRRR